MKSFSWKIFDLSEMPSDHPPENNNDSVSSGIVFIKETEYGSFPYCRGDGHTGDSALLRVGDKIWRCPGDNEGCWGWREEEYDDRRCAECGEHPRHYRHTDKKHKRYHEFEEKKPGEVFGT